MTQFVNWILAQFVSGWHVFSLVVDWALVNPVAAVFWAGFWMSVLNYIVKITPTRLDDSLLDAVSRAIREGFDRADRVKGK